MTREELKDVIWDAILGSIDIDWNATIGAEAVMQALEKEVPFLMKNLVPKLPTMEEALRPDEAAGQGEATGYIIANGDGTKWRTLAQGLPVWTDDRDKAIRYASRDDAELAAEEDEYAWLIQPVATPRPEASDAPDIVERDEKGRIIHRRAPDALTALRAELAAVKRERDTWRDELAKVAYFVETHWQGAGLPLEAKWIINKLAASFNEREKEIEAAETEVARLKDAEPDMWTAEADGFKSFTTRATQAKRWEKGGMHVTAYRSLTAAKGG